VHTNNDEIIIDEENTKVSEEGSSSVDETCETQSNKEENEGIIDKTLEEAEVVQEAEIVEEEGVRRQ